MTRTTDRIDQTLTTRTSRRAALRMIGGGLIGGALTGVGLTAARTAMAQPAGRATLLSDLPVTGTASGDTVGVDVTFDGTATITALYTDEAHEALYASGILTGELSDDTAIGKLSDEQVNTGSFTSAGPITLAPAAAASQGRQAFAQTEGGCDVLSLVLGPLDLDVLGLVIDIPDPIVLDIRAEPGPGNLLGNLLCAVMGVLDGTGVATTGSGLQNQLDQINALLAGA